MQARTLLAGNSWRNSVALQSDSYSRWARYVSMAASASTHSPSTATWTSRPLRVIRFEMEWPPRSGQLQTFPEVDRAEWFTLPIARTKIVEGQRPLLDRLEKLATTN